jgi:hypothetical protein
MRRGLRLPQLWMLLVAILVILRITLPFRRFRGVAQAAADSLPQL